MCPFTVLRARKSRSLMFRLEQPSSMRVSTSISRGLKGPGDYDWPFGVLGDCARYCGKPSLRL